MKTVKQLYERLRALPTPPLGMEIGDFPLYEGLLAGCADRVAQGHSLDPSTVPNPDKGTLEAVTELRAKATLSAEECAFIEYFELLEEIRLAITRDV